MTPCNTTKKNGKWRVCVYFRELNKATLKYYFPLPFIDQVLDTLSGKKYFSFLNGYSRYKDIQIALEDLENTPSHVHGEPLHIGSYHLDRAMPQQPFKGKFWNFFSIL